VVCATKPEQVLVGPKWLLIGSVLLFAFVLSLKALKTEAVKEAQSEDVEDFSHLSELERLRKVEAIFMEDPFASVPKKSPIDPLGIAFCAVGLVMSVFAIGRADTSRERLIMIGVLVAIIALCVPMTLLLRRSTKRKLEDMGAEFNKMGTKALAEVRGKIAELDFPFD
jgi:hypothetical protein